MEDFFIDDKFHLDLESLISDLDLDDEGAIAELEEDWDIDAEETTLEPIFELKVEFVVNAIMEATDKWEDRFPEESDDIFKDIKKAIMSSIDIDKMNSLLPKLYYPNGNKFKITKKDLVEYIS